MIVCLLHMNDVLLGAHTPCYARGNYHSISFAASIASEWLVRAEGVASGVGRDEE